MILIDTPIWPWRGGLWGHMVSDVSFHELHQFAQQLGKRRIGFQGDHYDIDQVEYQRAVEMGAARIDSRELVRRLRDSGLRRRTKRPQWEIAYQSKDIHYFDTLIETVQSTVSSEADCSRLLDVLRSANSNPEVREALIVQRAGASAMVLEFDEGPELDTSGLDVFVENGSEDTVVFELIIGNC